MATRVAKTSPGRSRTGIRLTVASAAPVTMLVAPGPTDAVTAKVAIRSRMPRVADRGVHHGLLVAALVVAQRLLAGRVGELGALEQRLTDARDVAVPEDAPAAGEEGVLDAVALDVLLLEESDERLGHGQPGRHRLSS